MTKSQARQDAYDAFKAVTEGILAYAADQLTTAKIDVRESLRREIAEAKQEAINGFRETLQDILSHIKDDYRSELTGITEYAKRELQTAKEEFAIDLDNIYKDEDLTCSPAISIPQQEGVDTR